MRTNKNDMTNGWTCMLETEIVKLIRKKDKLYILPVIKVM
jgi:hypothetical protein